MQLMYETEIPTTAILRTYRTARWPNLLFLGACMVPVCLATWWLILGPGLPPLVWVFVGPFICLFGLVLLILIPALLHAVRASFRSSNWFLKIAHDGLYVQLRSYLNYHFGGDAKTVVFIPYADIRAVSRHTWRLDLDVFQKASARVERYLKVEMRGGNIKPVRQAIIAEKNFDPPRRWFASLKFGDLPMKVFKDGRVYVRWPGRSVLRELERFVDVIKPSREQADNARSGPKDKSNEDLIVDLVERGNKVDAVWLTQQTYGMNTTEAHDFVEQLSRDGAADTTRTGKAV